MADIDKGAAYLDSLTAGMPEAVSAQDLKDELRELWKKGLPPGDKTGWPSIDKHYTVAPGQFTIVTGFPSSGKSEWVDALQINLARQGWRTSYYSPENMPISLHIAKLAEKLLGKPFGHGPTERMTQDELDEARDEIGQWFQFLKSKTGDPVSVRSVTQAATAWLERQGEKRGLVIDPWNELEHWRGRGKSETEYISEQLSFLRGWARNNNVHVWLVAHPQKLRRDDGKLPTPTPDTISGSAHFWNKADCAITVERALADPTKADVNIYIQKVRFKHIGSVGMVTLRWDKVTGRYSEIPSLQAVKAYAMKGDFD
jgi:twinkle protein